MRTEKLLPLEEVPDHLKAMIVKDIKSDGKQIPSHVMLEMEGDVVHGYRPIYVMEANEMPLPSTSRKTQRRRRSAR